jgi:hypothetical protein
MFLVQAVLLSLGLWWRNWTNWIVISTVAATIAHAAFSLRRKPDRPR